MSDPITCPECGGGGEDRRIPGHALRCMFCHGRGSVGGPDDPHENPPPPPTAPPPAWEHKVWQDPFIAASLPCRYCLGGGSVTRVDRQARTLVSVPCVCQTSSP